MFKNYIESLFFNYLNDTVSSVRDTGIKSLETIIIKFGSSWTTVNLIPKLQSVLTQPKISYLHRMCVLNSLAICAKHLNSNQINEFILPALNRGIKDKVPNVRFFTIKLYEIVVVCVDSITKDKIKGMIRDYTNDDDLDVKFHAARFTSTF